MCYTAKPCIRWTSRALMQSAAPFSLIGGAAHFIFSALLPRSSSGQDAALSRLKQEFDSPTGRQSSPSSMDNISGPRAGKNKRCDSASCRAETESCRGSLRMRAASQRSLPGLHSFWHLQKGRFGVSQKRPHLASGAANLMPKSFNIMDHYERMPQYVVVSQA